MDGGGTVHGYLTPRELSRAILARWWKTNPHVLRSIPLRTLREMAEFMERAEKAADEARERAMAGPPTPGRAPTDVW